MLVADHEPHPGQTALLEPGEEGPSAGLVLAVADVEAEDLPGTVCGDAAGHDDRYGHHLPGGAADLEVGGVEIDVGELDMAESSYPEGTDDLDQRAGRPPSPRRKRPGDAAARLEDRREDEPLGSFGIRSCTSPACVDNTRGRAPLRSVTPCLAAHVTGRADPLGGLQLDQLLQHQPHRITDQIRAVTGAARLRQLGQTSRGKAIGGISFGACLAVRTDDLADGPCPTEAAPDHPAPHHAPGRLL